MKIRFAVSAIACIFLFASSQAFAQDRAEIEKKIDSLRERLSNLEKEFLEPAQEDKAAFAEFLSQPDTGIIRLLPRDKFQKKMTLSGGGAYFSFSRLTHEYGFGSDIELQGGRFSVGFAGADYGFMTPLGNVPLDTVNVESPGVVFLANYTPPTVEQEAREQYQAGWKGIQADHFIYKSRVEAKVNTTYVLRSINYGSQGSKQGSNVLVAFRPIREDADGSLTVVWKLLKKSSPFVLVRR
jgi:hypothetical protein